MSHSIQPVAFAHGSTRNVPGSATMTKFPAPSISSRPMPPPSANTLNTVRCEVSLASSVEVMVMPDAHGARGLRRHQCLAAQHAMLIAERKAHRLRACGA